MATNLQDLRENSLMEGTADFKWSRTLEEEDPNRELLDAAAEEAATVTEHIASDAHAIAAAIRSANSNDRADCD
jgi:hypothetical protein